MHFQGLKENYGLLEFIPCGELTSSLLVLGEAVGNNMLGELIREADTLAKARDDERLFENCE